MIVVILTLFISACSTAMALGSVTLFGLQPDIPLIALIFFSTVTIYTLDRIRPSVEDKDGEEDSWRLRAFAEARPATMVLLGFGLAGTGILTLFQSVQVLLALIPLGLVSVGYTVPIGRWRLKDLPYAKTFIVASVWTLVTAWLPIWSAGVTLENELLGHLLSRFLFVFAITLPFDYRDRDRDRRAGLKTLPQRLELRGTQGLAAASLAGFVGLHAVWDPHNMFVANLATAIITLAVIAFMRHDRGDLYYSVGVDGTMMLQYALLLTLAN